MKPADPTGWILLIGAAAFITAKIMQAITGRYPWEPKAKYIVTVLAFLHDGPPKPIYVKTYRSMAEAITASRYFHEDMMKNSEYPDRYAVNIQFDVKWQAPR